MAAIAFQVEVVLPEMGLVIARQLSPAKFRVINETRLGGCLVAQMALPPALVPETKKREDLHAFRCRDVPETQRFRAGQVVELSEYREL